MDEEPPLPRAASLWRQLKQLQSNYQLSTNELSTDELNYQLLNLQRGCFDVQATTRDISLNVHHSCTCDGMSAVCTGCN